MLKVLLWKDARICADVFLGGLALLCGSYFLALLLAYSDPAGFEWGKVIAGGASLTRFSSLLICALLGGYAFAKESEERSSLFLGALPVRKTHVVASKLIVASAMVVATWFTSLAVMAVGLGVMGYTWHTFGLVLEAMTGYMGMSLMVFGVAWFVSLYLNVAVGSAFAGLLAIAPVCLVQFLLNRYFEIDNPAFFHPVMVVAISGVGVSAIVAGSVLFTKRGIVREEVSLKRLLGAHRCATEAPGAAAVRPGCRMVGESVALLWKDFRLIRTSVSIGVALMVLPYLVVVWGGNRLAHARSASTLSIALGVLAFAFWSGHIMTAESASRANGFLAYLPVHRVKALLSRLGVSFVPMAVISTFNLLVLLAANNTMPGEVRFDAAITWADWINAPYIIMGFALMNGGLLAFGLAWLLSAHYQRPAVAIMLGVLGAPLGLGFWVALSTYCADHATAPSPFLFVCLFTCAAIALTVVMVFSGSQIALKKWGREA